MRLKFFVPALVLVLSTPVLYSASFWPQMTILAQSHSSSPPITAVAGQVIRGVQITSAIGPCIIIDNVANVWVDNVELGPCAGNGVRITGSQATGIRITNSLIHTERAGPRDSGVGVYIEWASDVLVQGNQFSYNESSVYAVLASNIRVVGNYSLNPLGPLPRGQHVQFNSVSGGEITDNYGESKTIGVRYNPDQEDAINSFKSWDILIARNYIVGGHSTNGCGIIVGDKGGDRNTAEDNTLIRTGQCGIGVAGGNTHIVRRNKILDTNVSGGKGNIGIYIRNYSSGSCSGHTVSDSIVSNRLPNGSYNNYWNSGTCGPVVSSGNIFGDAARLLLTPESEKLPPPPIPPIAGPNPRPCLWLSPDGCAP